MVRDIITAVVFIAAALAFYFQAQSEVELNYIKGKVEASMALGCQAVMEKTGVVRRNEK